MRLLLIRSDVLVLSRCKYLVFRLWTKHSITYRFLYSGFVLFYKRISECCPVPNTNKTFAVLRYTVVYRIKYAILYYIPESLEFLYY